MVGTKQTAGKSLTNIRPNAAARAVAIYQTRAPGTDDGDLPSSSDDDVPIVRPSEWWPPKAASPHWMGDGGRLRDDYESYLSSPHGSNAMPSPVREKTANPWSVSRTLSPSVHQAVADDNNLFGGGVNPFRKSRTALKRRRPESSGPLPSSESSRKAMVVGSLYDAIGLVLPGSSMRDDQATIHVKNEAALRPVRQALAQAKGRPAPLSPLGTAPFDDELERLAAVKTTIEDVRGRPSPLSPTLARLPWSPLPSGDVGSLRPIGGRGVASALSARGSRR